MNTYITLACLLAVLGVSHCNPVGYGYGGAIISHAPIIAPAAISTANLYKAAPIPVIRTAAIAPIITPVVRTVPVATTYNLGGWGGYGYGGLGLGYGGSLGYGGLGYGGLGYGLGWGGKGLGLGGLGYGYGSKIIH